MTHHIRQYIHITMGKEYGAFFSNPMVGIPSGRLNGQIQATIVDTVNAKAAAMIKIGAGLDSQNQSSPARAENKVKKSETATFKKIEVVI